MTSFLISTTNLEEFGAGEDMDAKVVESGNPSGIDSRFSQEGCSRTTDF